MKTNISTDCLYQTDLIQQIIDNQSITESHKFFMDKLIKATVQKETFWQGVYCYALSSLFFKHNMFNEAIEYADKALSYFNHLSSTGQNVYDFMLWLILEIGFINCARGNTESAKAMLAQYSEYTNNHTPSFEHHFTLLKARVGTCTDELKDSLSLIDELLEYSSQINIRRHFYEYNQIFQYLLNLGIEYKPYLDKVYSTLEVQANDVNSQMIKRRFYSSSTKYFKFLGETESYAQAFFQFEDRIERRTHIFRKIKLDIINNKERVYHQNELKTRLKNKVDTLKKVSHTDPLTKLPNRYSFNEYGQEAFSKAIENHETLGIILIDIDNFKYYNDTYGHLVGDRCLSLVGLTLKKVFGEHFVARYAGDEFIALFKNSDAETIMSYANKLKEQLKPDTFIQIDEENTIEGITVSQGVICLVPNESNRFSDLFHAADTALYTGKMNGRNNITYLPLI